MASLALTRHRDILTDDTCGTLRFKISSAASEAGRVAILTFIPHSLVLAYFACYTLGFEHTSTSLASGVAAVIIGAPNEWRFAGDTVIDERPTA
jgi:hypothetical protein